MKLLVRLLLAVMVVSATTLLPSAVVPVPQFAQPQQAHAQSSPITETGNLDGTTDFASPGGYGTSFLGTGSGYAGDCPSWVTYPGCSVSYYPFGWPDSSHTQVCFEINTASTSVDGWELYGTGIAEGVFYATGGSAVGSSTCYTFSSVNPSTQGLQLVVHRNGGGNVGTINVTIIYYLPGPTPTPTTAATNTPTPTNTPTNTPTPLPTSTPTPTFTPTSTPTPTATTTPVPGSFSCSSSQQSVFDSYPITWAESTSGWPGPYSIENGNAFTVTTTVVVYGINYWSADTQLSTNGNGGTNAQLWNTDTGIALATVTMGVNAGYNFFQFTTPVTLSAGVNYAVGVNQYVGEKYLYINSGPLLSSGGTVDLIEEGYSNAINERPTGAGANMIPNQLAAVEPSFCNGDPSLSLGTGSFTVSGHVCIVANVATTQSQPNCSNAQAPHYLDGSMVQAFNSSSHEIASGFTSGSQGSYTFSVAATYGSNITIKLAVYGPQPTGTLAADGWWPIQGTYLLTLPQYGPLANYTNLDFEYVVPEAANSIWWHTTTSAGGFDVPCLNLSGRACSAGGSGGGGVFTAVGIALLLPVFGPVGTVSGPTKPDSPESPDPGGIAIGGTYPTFSVSLTNPNNTTSTVLVSNDQNAPVIGSAWTTTVNVPAQSTTTDVIVGEGGMQTTVGTVIITDTQPGPGVQVSVPVEDTPPLPIPIDATGTLGTGGGLSTVSASSMCEGTQSVADNQSTGQQSLFIVTGIENVLICLFMPTITVDEILGPIQQSLSGKVGVADFYEAANWLCSRSAWDQPCDTTSGIWGLFNTGATSWTVCIPYYRYSSGTLDNSTLCNTLASGNAYVDTARTVFTLGLILFAVGGIASALLSFFGFGGSMDTGSSNDEYADNSHLGGGSW